MLSSSPSPSRRLIAVALCLAVAGFALAPLPAAAQRGTRLSESEFIDAMNKGLDTVKAKLEKLPKGKLKFASNLFFAHGAAVKNIPAETLLAYVDLLKEAGVQRIDINPGVFPFRRGDAENIAKYDRVVQRIRDAKLELAINPEPNRGEGTYSSIADWETECIALYSDLAKRYRPDIFVLIHEPTTMAARLGVKSTPEEWRQFVVRTAAAVKKESPSTKLAAGGLAHEMDYYRQFVELKELDMLTVNIYDIGQLSRYNMMIQMANRAKKPVYIGETWRSPYSPGDNQNLETFMTRSIGDGKFQALDMKWLEVMAMYASALKMEAITPFWTTSFVAYAPSERGSIDPAYNKRVVEGLTKKERTSTFREFQELVRRYR